MPTCPYPLHRVPCVEVARIQLPPVVARLYELAYNLWWTWTPPARELFRRLDAASWELYRNPVQLLLNVEPGAWSALLASPAFRGAYDEVTRALDTYLAGPGGSWYARRAGPPLRGPVAYFSTEFGLHHSLALYSGGLGVLSGDHLKSASDLGLPMVGVGLLYRQGYFHQTLDAEGRQQHFYPTYDFSRLPMRPAADELGRPVEVSVTLPGREVWARVWVALVGRVPLLLLDCDIPRNDSADRAITNQLYVQSREMRLIQELVLGVGGVRALSALGIEPGTWHVNEGHCALLQLERLRELRQEGVGPADWRARLAESVVFTTHTPVPAGNEQFDAELARRYLEPWASTLGLPVGELLALGRLDPAADAPLNLTILGLKTSRRANAVSSRNGEVVRAMWAPLVERDPRAAPIIAITNGVHTPTWVGPEVAELFAQVVGTDWRERLLEPEAWAAVRDAPDGEVWAAHRDQKARLGRFVVTRLREQFARHGRSPDELRRVGELFDPEALTIGFARRFATYKRAHLLFHDIDRLRDILGRGEGGVQVVLAGKAHPADQGGQELIRRLFQLGQSDELEGRIFFLEDYDMQVGQMLAQGVEVWLNTPRPPLEASGTSGQKAAVNGALNLSVLDGWWPEGWNGENGWAIGEPGEVDALGEGERDQRDAAALYRLLEDEVLPAFAARENGLPLAWIRRMKQAMATITPRFSSHRMVSEYLELLYAAPGVASPSAAAVATAETT
ncbi:MAG: alpha-glucan family phosphorylase [Thermoanaerobaculia bacterium]